MEGRILGDRYRVDALIGEGGLALVYRGTDLVLGRTVAIKILRPEYARDPEIVARFRSEARSAARLNHPNIVQIFDTGEEDETYYLVMEYLPEPDLKRIFEHYAPLPRHKVIDVIAQCCRALNYAHRAQIVHRDVKPQNILFTDDGIAKLSDFGILRLRHRCSGGPGQSERRRQGMGFGRLYLSRTGAGQAGNPPV